MSDTSQGPGWWQASDDKWYPPEQAAQARQAPPAMPPGAGYGAPTGPPPGYGPPPGSAPAYGDPGAAGYGPASGIGGYGPPAGQGQLAEWGQRVVATLIDTGILLAGWVVVFVVALIFAAISEILGAIVGLVGYLVLAVGSFYFYYLNGTTGQSPGKRLTGLMVLGEQTGQPIGGGLGVVRGLAHVIDGIICYIGYLFPLWDPKKQTIADKVMKTVVVTGAPKRSFGPELFRP